MRKAWYRFENAADPGVVDIQIIDVIGDWIDDYFGFGVTAKAFVDQLAELTDSVTKIRLHVNSPGGDVFGAVNIANALRDQRMSKGRTVEVLIEGLAASAASIVIMAGSSIRIADNAMVMIHNPWTVAMGSSAEMRQAADALDKIRAAIIASYQWQSTLSSEALGELMDATTWMSADEALANGFATEKIEGFKAAASLDPRGLAKLTIPERFRDRVAALVKPAPAPAPAPADPQAVIRACKVAGCAELADDLLGLPMAEVTARLDRAQADRVAAAAQAKEIRALCVTAKLPELADSYIEACTPVDIVRRQLLAVTARVDAAPINGQLPPDAAGAPDPRALSPSAIYAERNGRPAAAKGVPV